MKFIKALFDFYINSSIHVAIAVTCFVYITSCSLIVEVTSANYLLVFFGSISGYNFVKYAPIAGLHHRSLVRSLRVIQIFSALCVLPLLYIIWFIQLNSFLLLLGCGILTLLYALPFLRGKNLRKVAGIKIVIVALVWAFITVGLPVTENTITLDTDLVLMFFQRFLIVIVLILPFDIRDVVYDNPRLWTLPQWVGVKKTKAVGVTLLVLVLILEGFKDNIAFLEVILLFAILCVIAVLVVASKVKQPVYYASFVVESVPIIWAAGVYLFR